MLQSVAVDGTRLAPYCCSGRHTKGVQGTGPFSSLVKHSWLQKGFVLLGSVT